MTALRLALVGNLQKTIDAELLAGEIAVTSAVRTVMKDSVRIIRRQLAKAGLSKRLQNTIRGDVYPEKGNSLGAAGELYTRAKPILAGLERSITITSKGRGFLMIPTEAALSLVRKSTKRSQVLKAVESKVGKLQFVQNRGTGGGVLIANNLQFSEKTGKFRKDVRKKAGGTGSSSAVMFVLVKQVRTRKVTNSARVGAKANQRLPRLILRKFDELEARR